MDDTDATIKKLITGHYLIVAALLLAIACMFIWNWTKKNEKFNPTATMRFQQRDGLGEGMDAGPGSLSAQILSSPDFACGTRTPVTNDAWDWMNSEVHSAEQFSGPNKPKTDNEFSKIISGY